ncbi:hypothetical protein C8Q80DRAFT_1109714 [Daedaleopsis nitida]|nr:hypothetical protein C8Q80DRAFT_1109714 [Daedaleopsis nitida]
MTCNPISRVPSPLPSFLSTSVQTPSVPAAASLPHTASSHPIHLRTDPYCGRKYHASRALPENTDLLGACTPYSYTIWKRFRNEVCAECWRYDRGRRAFLTRRDDEGLEITSGSSVSANNASPGDARASTTANGKATSRTGAGLWFCDVRCQETWIDREGIEAVGLLRQLEAARQRKSKVAPTRADAPEKEITQEVADGAWEGVRELESSPKEVRRWRDLRLDDYETDMARYVLLALLRCCRERKDCARPDRLPSAREKAQTDQDESDPDVIIEVPSNAQSDAEGGDEQGSDWQTFSSLQTNELSLLQACPEILEHQTRIYRLIKGCFGNNTGRSRSKGMAASSPPGIESSAGERVKDAKTSESHPCGLPELASVISIGNVRTVLGVDPGNAFGIWEVPLMEESECLGFAVYPIASLFNHHCSPNVRKEREGRSLRFLTTRSVSEGEEVCISYGHVEGMSLGERQAELLEGWYFGCRCGRCMAEESG